MTLHELDQTYILNTYKRLPLTITKAKGSYLYDRSGKKYLDMYAGIAVSSLGHSHKVILRAIKKQMKKHLHLSNYFVSEPVVTLAQSLVEHAFPSQVFFTNSGTEAIEASIKLVRKWGKAIDPEKQEMVALHESFHGRTMGGLSLTGQPKYQHAFAPLLSGIKHIERNNIHALRSAVSDKTCALYLEMIQGESGIEPLHFEYIEEVIKLAQRYNFLVVADEIQTGLMRTGKLFAYQHTRLIPDILTLAKSLGGGIPLGAMLVGSHLKDVLKPGDHGSTFGGNPLACAMGLASFHVLSSKDMTQKVEHASEYLFNELKVLQSKYDVILDIRGKGLMIGIDLGKHAQLIQAEALKRGILLNLTHQTVIRLLPPLNIKEKELALFLEVFEDILKLVQHNN